MVECLSSKEKAVDLIPHSLGPHKNKTKTKENQPLIQNIIIHVNSKHRKAQMFTRWQTDYPWYIHTEYSTLAIKRT